MEGDSLIWGYAGMSNGVAQKSVSNPPDVAQAELQKQIGATVTTENNAVPGTTVANALAGDGNGASFTTRLSLNSAQIVLSDYATNDSVGTSVDVYTANLIEWVKEVKASGKTPVLEEPNPSCKPKHAALPQFRDAMVKVANQEDILLIQQYDYVLSMRNWQSMLRDCTHPNDALYALKAQREAQALAPLVKSLQ